MRDCFDLKLTNADGAAAAGYALYVREFLSYGAHLRGLFAAADAAPAAPMLNAHAAALHLAFEGAEGWRHAAPYLERMRARSADATAREQAFCETVERWAARDFHGALALLDSLTVRWPADLCAIKWGQYHAFNVGDQAALLRFGERARIVHEGAPYVHGMAAFALEQSHRLEEAEAEGLRATEIAIDDAWAHHAVAHVMDARGRHRDGIRWLDHCAHTWERKGVFIRDHNWWHAALFRLEAGDLEGALGVFDARLWGAWPEFPQEQIGAVSMLWRLELRGAQVGARWEPVAAQARVRAGEHVLPFHDLHYLYALARAGAPGEARRFLLSLESHAQAQSGPARRAWVDACAPIARGVLAFAEGRRADAGVEFARALPHLTAIGGSHAQRHLFVELAQATTKRAPERALA